MKARPLPPLDYLKECFKLDETCPSGLRWRVRPTSHFKANVSQWNGRFSGKPVGCIKATDTERVCWIVNLSGKTYYVHRIAYSIFHNTELSIDDEIDHVDVNALNNTPSNLRIAKHSDNSKNTKVRKDNTSGFKGVSWSKTGKYWWGEVVCAGKRFRVHGCSTAEKCHELLSEIREKHHKEFTNHG